MAVTTGMVGHGFYDQNSGPQWTTTEVVLPWLEAAVAEMALAATPATIGVADFGCSEGANSIRVMTRLTAALRGRTPRPIQTVHSDLPTNNYTALLRDPRTAAGSVFSNNVFSAVVGGSMFDQLFREKLALHLATTFNAIGFLSRRPVARLPGYILPNGPSARRGVGHVDDAERAAFAAQALADVEGFLRARAAELVPGGKLLDARGLRRRRRGPHLRRHLRRPQRCGPGGPRGRADRPRRLRGLLPAGLLPQPRPAGPRRWRRRRPTHRSRPCSASIGPRPTRSGCPSSRRSGPPATWSPTPAAAPTSSAPSPKRCSARRFPGPSTGASPTTSSPPPPSA